MKKLLLSSIALLAVAGAGCSPAPAPMPPVAQPPSAVKTPPVPAPAPPASAMVSLKTKSGLASISLASPKEGDTVTSPISFSGEARGWYFEGTFPVWVLNASGKMIGSGAAQADGDWMTSDWVPFKGEFQFPPQPAGSKGTLRFIKDNPSGDPSKDDFAEISITF